MYGYIGKFLRVNLTKGDTSVENLKPEIAQKFVGARGLATKVLFDETDPKVEPFSPENKLIFATGPLTGTGAPAACRYMVVTKSPLTGGIANSSCGGFWGSELKFAGYDMVIIEGAASEPVYLWIENEKIEIRSAKSFWGKDTSETNDLIRSETDENARVACIGPGGENLVRFGCIISEGRAAGRGGVGAVMGSKNLKAIAVRGTKGFTVFDKDGFYRSALKALKNIENEYALDHFGKFGTPSVIALTAERGVLPTRNFQSAVYEDWEKISGEKLFTIFSKRKRGGVSCFGCPVACGRMTKVIEPEFQGEGHGPEYETLGSFGAGCGVNNLAAISKANFICNEKGIDTISTAVTIACAMELFEEGFIPREDVGFDLRFGDARAIVTLSDQIARKEGFGKILAEGSYRMAEKYGHPELSMSSKKQEFPSYDPRGLQGMGVQYATQNRGGDHIRGEQQDMDLYGVYDWRMCKDRGITYVDSFYPDDKPLLTKETQDWFSIIDSSGLCNFMFYLGNIEDDMLALLETATGFNFNGIKGMMKAGERIFNLERLYNLEAGLSDKDDILPKRMLEEPVPEGPCKGHIVHLDRMLPEYYKLRGWNENGIPIEEKLKELELSDL